MARRLTQAERNLRDLTEREFQVAYVKALLSLGFRVSHHYDSRFSDEGTKGFPDLTIAGYGFLFFREVKREQGVVSDDQHAWINLLVDAGADVDVRYPRHWELCMQEAERFAGRSIDPELRQLPHPKRKKKKKKKRKPPAS